MSSRATPTLRARAEPHPRLLRALAAIGLAYAAGASGQLTATLTAVSDYRYRGISLSGQKPALQGNLNYDDPRGWYGGLFVSTVQLAGEASTTGQAIAYLGMATRVGDDLHWDVGANYSAFSEGRDYDYGQVYAGIATQRVNARVYYSPDYFGLARESVYTEVNATHPLDDRFRLIAHVGVLVPLGSAGAASRQATRNPVDALAGIGVDIAGFDLQLVWVGTNSSGAVYPVTGAMRRNTVVVSASRSF